MKGLSGRKRSCDKPVEGSNGAMPKPWSEIRKQSKLELIHFRNTDRKADTVSNMDAGKKRRRQRNRRVKEVE